MNLETREITSFPKEALSTTERIEFLGWIRKSEEEKEEKKEELDTSSWQTYRNEEFGFEVKYPEGCEVKNSGVVNVVTGSTLSIIKNNNPDNLMMDECLRDATLIW